VVNESWRLFIAIELPPNVLKAITQVQDDLKQAVPEHAIRWTRPEGIHLTLKFLGDVQTKHLNDLKTALSQIAAEHTVLELGIEGLGCFPNYARPRVLWVGLIGDTRSLQSLQTTVERYIAPLGFPTEKRGFKPHLTLGRTARSANRGDVTKIGGITQEHDIGHLTAWQVKSLSLMRSHLKPTGAQYTQIAEATLNT
jgi:2'-5' RNA ligase